MKFKFVFLYIILIFISLGTFAQQKYYRDARYNFAIGVKFFPGSISVKHTLYSKNKFEGLIYNWKGVRAVGLFEIENRIDGIEGLCWYFGPGAHIQFREGTKVYAGSYYLGFDGVIGIDWKIRNAPINLSLDWQPSLDFDQNNENFKGGFGGIGLRYVIR
jgi:hypothetical protein